MPKIEILEKDLTTPGVVSESTDIIYIPGFVDTAQEELYRKDVELNEDGTPKVGTDGKPMYKKTYIGLNYHEPKLFNSVAEFVSLCGKQPATFTTDQKYSDLSVVSKDGTVSCPFTSDSRDVSDIMFVSGEADPAYVMAKELLASGISVMYERMNPNVDGDVAVYIPSPSATKDDEVYYINSDGEYVQYADFEKAGQPAGSATRFVVGPTKRGKDSNIYCTLVNGEYVPVPDDWSDFDNLYKLLVADTIEVWNEETCVNYAYVDNSGESPRYFKYNMPGIVPSNAYVVMDKNDTVSIQTAYRELQSVFDTSNLEGIVDKGNYSIKYVTSGGYPTYEYDNGSLVVKMLNFAETRGDCMALIDHTDYLDRELNPAKVGSLYKSVNDSRGLFTDSGEYGAMFTPWATYNRITSDYKQVAYTKYGGTSMEKVEQRDELILSNTQLRAPGSFAYLMSLADSIKTNANWLAVAGVTRGKVRNLSADGMTTVIPNSVADAMQPRNNAVTVNAITNIAPYGYTIWGNRTLKPVEENLVATNFLNIRNLISDIKKTCYRVARKTTFEQNTDILWINFSSEIGKLLDRMKTGFGISGYKIVKDVEHEKAAEKATLCAKIIIYPTYAVEDFYITVVLKDDEVVVQ
jgi:hypothetical protein